jgi:hypothetical protein
MTKPAAIRQMVIGGTTKYVTYRINFSKVVENQVKQLCSLLEELMPEVDVKTSHTGESINLILSMYEDIKYD